ncbi:MAG: hypothetical protein JWR09_1139 [Mucilaginibacter sp.]|nr:hypothetical protein [Mucilaginibacter sp.]
MGSCYQQKSRSTLVKRLCSLEWQNLELFSQRFETVSEFLRVETLNFYGLIFNGL